MRISKPLWLCLVICAIICQLSISAFLGDADSSSSHIGKLPHSTLVSGCAGERTLLGENQFDPGKPNNSFFTVTAYAWEFLDNSEDAFFRHAFVLSLPSFVHRLWLLHCALLR